MNLLSFSNKLKAYSFGVVLLYLWAGRLFILCFYTLGA